MGEQIKAVRVTFDIIETLRRHDGAGVSAIAEEVDKPVSTVHDHLKTLTELNYVVQDGYEYRLGTKFVEIGEQELRQRRIYRISKGEIDKLAEETGEFAGLMIEEHGLGVMLYSARGVDAVKIRSYPGGRMPIHSLAAGKVILAHLPDECVQEIIDQHGLPAITERTITDSDELRDQFSTIREQGYALDHGERIEGVRTMAAPIFSKDGEVIASVAIAVPIHQMDEDEFVERISDHVMKTSNVIEVNLKYADM